MHGVPVHLATQEVTEQRATSAGSDEGLLGQAALVLAEYRTEVLTGWVWRLSQRTAHQAWPELRLDELLADVPALVEAVLAMLRARSADTVVASPADVVASAQRQMAFRLHQGVPLAMVLNEQALLRDEVWMLFARRLPAASHPAELLALARVLDGALQRVLESCILIATIRNEGQQEVA
jgi:hypothetical protein